MAGSYIPNISTTYGVRSVSLPTTSHPSVDSIKQELNNIQTCVISSSSSSCKPSIEAIYDGLLKLSRLYECMHEFISLLCLTQNEKWVEELMDRMVGFLDICDMIRDIMWRYKEHVRDLQCASRRRKGDTSLGSSIARYNSFRKTVKKEVKILIASLNRSMVAKSQDHYHHEVVVVMIKMVFEVTVSVFVSLLMPFVISNSQTTKTNKWSMVVSKLIQRTRVVCEEHHYRQSNGIDGLDHVVLRDECIKVGRFSLWWNDASMLEAMEAQIERIEDGLECVFRSLIRTRASILNIVSHN
ncbi:hypothetical protein L1987_65639 [Smallanthus sonchifolius]|uniref:Uncharacterized protein n=1 Tax=Smallanthus sonchifolius TaxID=185202 RepID=A0ACB9BV89_9ASTR|nr:hypothetical protein L1987_65639 [Smallanthus sonchifolius]